MNSKKNYITPAGYARLIDELTQLQKQERPELLKTIAWAAANGDRSENADYIYGKKRLREIDRRVRFLSKRLENIEVIDPGKVQSDKVQFGATVTVIDSEDIEKTYVIVGVDEVNTDIGHISWRSPIGRRLLGKEEGDVVEINSPKGSFELEIVDVLYKKIEISME